MNEAFRETATAAPAGHPRDAAPSNLGSLDLHVLGRRAAEVRDARLGRRAAFVRTRQLGPGGDWRGPRDAALAFIEELDVEAAGGFAAVRAAGVELVVAGRDARAAEAAADAGLSVLWRLPFANGESDAERLTRLAQLPARLAGLMPAPVGEAYGLDTLRLFALCRLAAPQIPHLWADVTTLGPRLAQMTFGFGADRLYAPIVAERALRLGANANNPALTRKEAATLIRGAGLAACEALVGGTLEEVTP